MSSPESLTGPRTGLGPHFPYVARTIHRISRNGQEPIIDVDQVEAIEPAIRSSEPGRYLENEIGADGLRRGNTTTPLERG